MREGGYRRVNCPVFPYFIACIVRGRNRSGEGIGETKGEGRPVGAVDRDLRVVQGLAQRLIDPGHGADAPFRLVEGVSRFPAFQGHDDVLTDR